MTVKTDRNEARGMAQLMRLDARATIAAEGGAILDLDQGSSYLAAAAHDIFLFERAR